MGNSRDRRKLKRFRSRILAEIGQPQSPIAPTVSNNPVTSKQSVMQRVVVFFEHSLFTLPVGILSGLIGMFYFWPILGLCGICILLAVDRSGAVGGLSLRKKIISYAVIFMVTTLAMFGAGRLIDKGAHDSLQKIASTVVDTLRPLLKTAAPPQPSAEAKEPKATATPADQPPTVTCKNALRFTQEEEISYLSPVNKFGQRITIFPRHFKKDTVLNVIILTADKPITGGSAQGVMVNENTGDPLAAGISIASGTMGIVTGNSNSAQLWLQDVDKFSNAKAVVVTLNSNERFKVECVQQPPVPKTEYIQVPNGGSKN
jgi:hypothetical protein